MTENETPPLIIVEDLHFSFLPKQEVIKGINFSLNCGESFVILGENGSGKSTLFLCMLNLLSNFTGTIRISNMEVSEKYQHEIRKKVGIMFQDPNDQLFLPTVQQELEFGPFNLGINGPDLKSRIASVIDTLKLQNLIDKKTFHLSYGEKKKIAFASIFSMDPEIYLLDEPFANLDPQTKKEFSEILKSLHKKKKNLLIISHNLDKIPKFIKRAVVIHQGEILFDGLINDLFKKTEILQRANLELPMLSKIYLKLVNDYKLNVDINFPREESDLIEFLKHNFYKKN